METPEQTVLPVVAWMKRDGEDEAALTPHAPAEAEIARLRAERDEARSTLREACASFGALLTAAETGRDMWHRLAGEAQAERDAARDERDAALADAARYRAVRFRQTPDAKEDDRFIVDLDANMVHANASLAGYFDDAIDAALAVAP